MGLNVSVILATCGERRWVDLAAGRALPSVAAQTCPPSEVVVVHDPVGVLHEVRNVGAERATGEWLCFLDADDELAPGYLEAMAFRWWWDQNRPEEPPTPTLYAPAVQWCRGEFESTPDLLDDRDIGTINPCAVGTLISRSLFLDVGGFWSWPAWEDWCLFRRCWLVGAAIVHVPGAVYRAHVSDNGRNASPEANRRLHEQITARHCRWVKERAA